MDRIVDSNKIEQLEAELAALEEKAVRIRGNKSFRFAETLARLKGQAFQKEMGGFGSFWAWLRHKQPSDARFQPVGQLQEEMAAVRRQLTHLIDLPPHSLPGSTIWDGCYRDAFTQGYYVALNRWRPAPATVPRALPPFDDTHPVLLWPKTEDNNPLLPALRDAGFSCITVVPDNDGSAQYVGVLTVSQAAATFRHRFAAILCTSPLAAPFVDLLPHKLLWLLCPPPPAAVACPEYDRLAASAQAMADYSPTPEEASPQTFMQLCRKRMASTWDLVVFSTINYGFLFQRPQHLAQLAAETGRRVLFVNADAEGTQPKVLEKQGNLYVVQLASHKGPNLVFPNIYQPPTEAAGEFVLAQLEQLFHDFDVQRAVLKVEYPLWDTAALALKAKYGHPIVLDYLDDFESFPDGKRAEIPAAAQRLLQTADWTVASSGYLADQIEKSTTRFTILRNGVHYQHFAPAAGGKAQTPPVVGYYGVVSAWFAYEMVEALNASGLDVEIRLIGTATDAAKKRLGKCSKVKLLPALPYADLPAALAEFSVCIIPFDAENPLIKATNPVKFYEYLAAGKKVVATGIPELMPYRGSLALLTDDPEEFVQFVEECLNGTDTLDTSAQRRQFALENDWELRGKAYEQIFEGIVQKTEE